MFDNPIMNGKGMPFDLLVFSVQPKLQARHPEHEVVTRGRQLGASFSA